MEPEKLIRNTSLLLCFVAGFCDTLTFVAAGELFSAHVTGNFIVFAYDIIKHADTSGWQRLITFPVFVLAVMLGGRIGQKSTNMSTLLMLEGLLLLVSGVLSLFFINAAETGWQIQLIAMIIVVAMALQNTFGKLYNKATYGLTTVMTGNVTQVSLDFIKGITTKPSDPAIWGSFRKQSTLIVGFVIGCLAGALMAKQLGLVAVLLPALLLLGWLGFNSMFKEKAA